ncbi:MAG: hypothetical protein IJM34_03830 [Lachnospiraceae bacterium]|nr:hypothetical protein [Lachnospiraceae bacterium]
MNSVYSILNDIDTDLDEFEEEQLSDTEIKKINARLKNKLGSGTGGSTAKTLSTLGKAAVIVIGFMAVGGGVYAAAQYRKNLKDDMRVRATQTRVVAEEGDTVTKEMYDEVTGATATYEVQYDGAVAGDVTDGKLIERVVKNGYADAEITAISMDHSNMKVGVRFDFNDEKNLVGLAKTLKSASEQGACWNATEATGISLETKLDDTAFFNWGNKYTVEGNSLYLDLFMDTTMTMAYLDEIDRRYEERAAYLREHPEEAEAGQWVDAPVTDIYEYTEVAPAYEDERKEIIAARMQEFEDYRKALPDPLDSTISIIIDLGAEYGGTYSFKTRLSGEFAEGEHERISIDGGSAQMDLDGIYQDLEINAYSMGGSGFKLYGNETYITDWSLITKICEEQNIEYAASLRIRAWDDLGNTYLMLLRSEHGDGSKKSTPYGEANVDHFVAELYDNAFGLEQFGKEAGINYSSEWADGISEITFAIEKEVLLQDADRKAHNTVELISEPVTVKIQ